MTHRHARGACRATCPQGAPCACSDAAHTLHVCANERCRCHSAERYAQDGRHVTRSLSAFSRGGVTVIIDGTGVGAGWIVVERD